MNLDNLYAAWRSFRLGKADKPSVMAFEHNLEDNLFSLQRDLKDQAYCHGQYEKFIVCDPKRRVIHKAAVRDRVVHTLVAAKLEEIYQPVFIAHSFACQKERGTHAALEALDLMSRRQSRNYTRNFWYLKCDIRKFFDNIDHRILLSILGRRIADRRFIWLLERIIGSFATSPGRGLPLGNFTSQWLGNIYLNELDYFIKHHLRTRYYARYADDFILLADQRVELETCLPAIDSFLKLKLKLCLHPGKVFIKKFSQGIDWVGYRLLPRHVILKRQARTRMERRLAERNYSLQNGEIGLVECSRTLDSYLGQLSHCQGRRLADQIIHYLGVYD